MPVLLSWDKRQELLAERAGVVDPVARYDTFFSKV